MLRAQDWGKRDGGGIGGRSAGDACLKESAAARMKECVYGVVRIYLARRSQYLSSCIAAMSFCCDVEASGCAGDAIYKDA